MAGEAPSQCALYWRERRRKAALDRPNYSACDPFYHPRFVAAGRELAAMMNTPTAEPLPEPRPGACAPVASSRIRAVSDR
jgi:hypothetical protein